MISIKRPWRKAPPKCHPDRKHYSLGFCRTCYNNDWKARNPHAVSREKERMKQYVKKSRQNKRDWVKNYKSNKPCTDCGETYPPYVMEFDHVPGRGQKEFLLGRAKGLFSEKRMLAEIAKCDLVCANCHRERTWSRNQSRYVE